MNFSAFRFLVIPWPQSVCPPYVFVQPSKQIFLLYNILLAKNVELIKRLSVPNHEIIHKYTIQRALPKTPNTNFLCRLENDKLKLMLKKKDEELVTAKAAVDRIATTMFYK
uniref:Uncharacterized protein n=1 Tax=Megaselia scalaris TaxID=36166 RepID=T1GE78_MEGSC